MRFTFARERLTPHLQQELMPLLLDHWEEIAHYGDIPLCVNWDRYFFLEREGVLRLYTVRDGAGVLFGYSAFMVTFNLHYVESKQASQDVLYLDEAARGRMVGARFISWCDDELRREGVQVVFQHVKDAHNFGPLLERLGYERIEAIYGRRLDKHGNHGGHHGSGERGRERHRAESSTTGHERGTGEDGGSPTAPEADSAQASLFPERGHSGGSAPVARTHDSDKSAGTAESTQDAAQDAVGDVK